MKKTCNKLLAFVLALAMALSVSVVAFASKRLLLPAARP